MYSVLGYLIEELRSTDKRSETIDIAKGRYELPHSWAKMKKHVKNRWR